MRRVLLLILLCLALPLAASASSIGVSSDGGTITASSNTLSLAGDVIMKYDGIFGSNLGTVAFTTPGFTSGSVSSNGAFGAGGSFTITTNGSVSGLPSGTVFTGTFVSGTWTLSSNDVYTLSADVKSSTGHGGVTFTELTVQGTLMPNGSIAVESGDYTITSQVPEPGTLGLLGTGLVGLGGLLRKRIFKA
jgi:PEP-CTERM motif